MTSSAPSCRHPVARAQSGWLLVALLLAALALRLYRLDAQDIWWDEARNIDVAARPLAQIATAGELDIHPPIYFYLLHGWWRLTAHAPTPSGQDAFAVRFLSLWFGVLFVALMYALGRRVGGFWAGLGAALGAAFLPFLLGEAQETRMYTVLLVWLAGAANALLAAVQRGRKAFGVESAPCDLRPATCHLPPATSWFLFALFSALALLTHYAAVFALVALWAWAGLWALTAGRKELWPRLRTVLLAGLVTALLCLPGLPVALRQIPSYRNPNLVVPTFGGYLAELARVYGLGEHLDPAAAQPWLWALAALLIGGWLVGMANRRIGESTNRRISESANQRISESASRKGSRWSIRHSPFALLWSLLPLAIYYLVIMDRSTFATRYIAGALPGWLLLAGLAVAGWARLGKLAGAGAALALCVILAPGIAGDLTDPRYFREDTRGLAAWLQRETDPARDIILVDQRYPFGLYWPRWNYYADGFPPAELADLAPAQYLFVDINTIAERLSALARGRERVFWVRWFESDTDPRGAVTWILEKFGTRLGERAFRGYTVTWYATAPKAEFELAPTLNGATADFGDQVRLEAYALGGRGPGFTSTIAETRVPVAPADGPIWVVARWSRLDGAAAPGKALPRGLKATVVLEAADGFIVGSDDRPILNDRHLAPLHWSETEHPLGVYLVRATPATPPGTYTVKLAIYDPVTLTQLPASGPATRGTFAILGEVTLTRPARPAAIEQLPVEMPFALSWRGIQLLGRGPLPGQIGPGDQLSFDLFWRAEQDTLPDLRVWLTLGQVEHSGAAGAPWEEMPVAGYPTDKWQAGDVLRGRQHLRLSPDTPAGTYQLTLRLTDAAGGEASPPVMLGQVTVAGRPHVFEPPAQMMQRSGARFGELATLLGYDLVAPAARGEAVTVTLYWRAEGASAAPYAGTVQLLDAAGVLRAQRDQQPGDGAFPTTSWVAGEVLTDTYRVALPADNKGTSNYTVIVKLYDPETGRVLPVTLPDGTPAGDFLRLGEVPGQ